MLRNFKLHELVPDDVYTTHGEKCIRLMDKNLLVFIDAFHDYLNEVHGNAVSIIVNDWHWGGRFSQRGFRTRKHYATDDDYIKSQSQHKYGRGLDFDVYIGKTRMDPALVRKIIIDLCELDWVKPITFIEDGVNWVHVDTRSNDNGQLVVWHVKTGDVICYR